MAPGRRCSEAGNGVGSAVPSDHSGTESGLWSAVLRGRAPPKSETPAHLHPRLQRPLGRRKISGRDASGRRLYLSISTWTPYLTLRRVSERQFFLIENDFETEAEDHLPFLIRRECEGNPEESLMRGT